MSEKSSSASASSSQDRLHRIETFHDDDEGRRGKESTVHPLLSLYLDQALTDVVLTTSSNTSVAAHKVVLAAHSAYFRAIFAGASSGFCVENSRSVVRVENVDDETFRLLLRLMYGGDRLDVLPEESQRLIPRLMDAAAYLSVECVVEACSTYLLESLRVGNAIDVYLLSAGRLEYADVHSEAMKFIISNFSAILRSWEGAESLCHLSKDDVLHVLCGRHADCIHKGVDIVMALLLYTRCGDQCDGGRIEEGRARSQASAAGNLEDIVRRLGRETYRDEYSMALDTIRDLEKQAGAPLILSHECVDRVGVALFGPDTPRLFGATVDQADGEHGGASSCRPRSAFEQHIERQNCTAPNGNVIIAVGGIHSGWKAVRSTELYNIDNDTWSPGPICRPIAPSPMHAHYHPGRRSFPSRRARPWCNTWHRIVPPPPARQSPPPIPPSSPGNGGSLTPTTETWSREPPRRLLPSEVTSTYWADGQSPGGTATRLPSTNASGRDAGRRWLR